MSFQSEVLSDGPVVYYRMQEGSVADPAVDLSGNGRNGTWGEWGTSGSAGPLIFRQPSLMGEAGDYAVNVYHYTNPTAAAVPVTVKVEKVNPRLSVIYYDTLLLTKKGDEKTVVRFSMDKDGAISNINTVPVSLIQAVRK